MALRNARRGLTRKVSLSRLLTEHCGERYNHHLRPVSVREILEWADRYKRRFGKWPTRDSGALPGERNLTWSSLDYALKHGKRGLPGGITLPQLLDEHRRE
jgi:hypothetical protein